MITKEGVLHQQICDYLRLQYPEVIFRTDFAAGVKMTIGQASRHKRLQHSRAYPDLFIAEPRNGWHGLFIELKTESPYKADGHLKSNEHLQEQYAMLKRLQERGYMATFGIGFDHARQTLDAYLK